MSGIPPFQELSCAECQSGAGLDFEFTMAFQPFVEAGTSRVFGYEALVRGPNRESAAEILGRVNDSNRYRFDQACRVKAIELASELTRDVNKDPVRQAIVAGITETCRALKLAIIAEGIETKDEYSFLASKGVRLFQGYFFARPGFRSLPPISPEGLQALLTVPAQ